MFVAYLKLHVSVASQNGRVIEAKKASSELAVEKVVGMMDRVGTSVGAAGWRLGGGAHDVQSVVVARTTVGGGARVVSIRWRAAAREVSLA